MKTALLTMWYNEQFLAPFFLNHYKYIDEIHLFLDSDTSDKTLEIVEQFDNVQLYEFSFPDGMDDIIKTEHFNNYYKNLDADKVILVDSDEFIFQYNIPTNKDINFTTLYNVYRHVTENDLDVSIPIENQRRHGVLDPMYIKPNVVTGRLDNFRWGLGIHECWHNGVHYVNYENYNGSLYTGAHMAMADPAYVIERRIKNRKERQSKSNLEKGLTVQHHNITEEQIIAELKAHENDQEVF